MIAAFDVLIAGQLAVIEQDHRREGCHFESLPAGTGACNCAEVSSHFVCGVVLQRLGRDDAERMSVHYLYVEINFWTDADCLFGSFDSLVAVLQGIGLEEADGHRIVDADFTGNIGHRFIASASA